MTEEEIRIILKMIQAGLEGDTIEKITITIKPHKPTKSK